MPAQAHAQRGGQGERQEDGGGRDFAADGLAVHPVAGLWTREDDLVADAHFCRQCEDVVVGGEPVVVELLEAPVPVVVFEAGGQAPDAVGGFVDGDVVTGLGEVPGGCESGCAGTDDSDLE